MPISPTRQPSQLAQVLVTGILVACGGGDGGTPPATTVIARTSTSSGDDQNATVGQALALPLRVMVTENGAASSGVTVTWGTTTGGSLAPAGPTGADGVATSGWTLGNTSGEQTATATLSGASGSPVTFTAAALAGPATAIAKAGGDGQTGQVGTQLPLPLQARVTDQLGNGVEGFAVDWAASGGTVSSPSVATSVAGISTVNVALGGTAGPITITATAGALSGSPLTFTATATTAPPAGDIVVVNNGFNPPAITVAAGTTVVWTWGSGASGHNIAPAATMPTRSGGLASAPATYSFTFNTPGTYQYYCEAHGAPGFGMNGTVTVQ